MDNCINLKQVNEYSGQRLNLPLEPKKKKRKILKFLVFFIIFLFVGSYIFFSKIPISDQSSWVYKIPIIGQIKHLAESASKNLKGEENDRINILLLGMGGKNHDGGYLTDTIMLASLKPSEKKVALLSIPRDMTVPVENMGWRKINNINAFAEAANPDSGGLATSQAVSDVLGVPVDYFFRLDFQGFINIVDKLGGVNIYVDNTLDDYSYPILGKEDAYPYESRFEHLHVEKGWQKMDGELALKFCRSRHAAGAEGSDFARARRQQKILEAIKENLLSAGTLFNPLLIGDIISELNEHVSTNLKVWEMIKLWSLFKDVQKEKIINRVLDNNPDGLLTATINPEGAYVLLPRYGDYTEIQYLAKNIFSDAPRESKEQVSGEKSTIEIKNGTWINGLASQISLDLEKYGFKVTRVGNSSRQNFQKSVIYDLTGGEKSNSLSVLKGKTNANVTSVLPDWLVEDIKKEQETDKNIIQPDFILILGQEADQSSSGSENKD